MKILKLNKDFSTWMGLCPIDDIRSRRKEQIYFLLGLSPCVMMAIIIVSSLVSTNNNASMGIGVALHSAMPAAAAIKIAVPMLSMLMSFREKISSLFKSLRLIYDES